MVDCGAFSGTNLTIVWHAQNTEGIGASFATVLEYADLPLKFHCSTLQ